MVTPLPPDVARALTDAPFTYAEVGATAGETPAGYHVVRRTRVLRRRDLDGAAAGLLGWQVQERSGVRIEASATPLTTGTVARQRLGVGPLALVAPCRVVYVVDEPDRAGFAYGTLPGHPETGEELFLVERRDDGSLAVTVAAFSRPATRLARLGGPVTGRVQALITTRYLSALDR